MVVFALIFPIYKDRLHGQTRTGNPSETSTRAGKKGEAPRQGGEKGPEKRAENKQRGMTDPPGVLPLRFRPARIDRNIQSQENGLAVPGVVTTVFWSLYCFRECLVWQVTEVQVTCRERQLMRQPGYEY